MVHWFYYKCILIYTLYNAQCNFNVLLFSPIDKAQDINMKWNCISFAIDLVRWPIPKLKKYANPVRNFCMQKLMAPLCVEPNSFAIDLVRWPIPELKDKATWRWHEPTCLFFYINSDLDLWTWPLTNHTVYYTNWNHQNFFLVNFGPVPDRQTYGQEVSPKSPPYNSKGGLKYYLVCCGEVSYC